MRRCWKDGTVNMQVETEVRGGVLIGQRPPRSRVPAEAVREAQTRLSSELPGAQPDLMLIAILSWQL